jgi:hypothetical protein
VRTTLILSIVAACGSPGVGVSLDSGPLIAMSEGDPPRHIHVSGASKLTTDVMWATLDPSSGDLVLDPPCTTVPGTSGAPVLFYMQLDSTPIVVQVQPSAGGTCAPTLNACKVMSCSDGCTQEPQHRALTLDYDDVTDGDASIAFSIQNPDSVDLALHLTTDAPLKFKQGQTSMAVCVLAPNTNIVGAFTIDWILATLPGNENSPSVASGEYRFDWNLNDVYGLEVQWCAGEAPCALHRYTKIPPQLGTAQWCIDTNHAPTTAMTLGLRLWFQPMMGDGGPHTFGVGASLQVGGPVTLTASTARAMDSVSIDIDESTVPVMLTADLGTVGMDLLTLTTTRSPSDMKKRIIAIMPSCPPDN